MWWPGETVLYLNTLGWAAVDRLSWQLLQQALSVASVDFPFANTRAARGFWGWVEETPASREGLYLKQKGNVLLLFRSKGDIRHWSQRPSSLEVGGYASQPLGLPCRTLFRWCALVSEIAREGWVCYFQSETGSPYLFCALCFGAGRKLEGALRTCRKKKSSFICLQLS